MEEEKHPFKRWQRLRMRVCVLAEAKKKEKGFSCVVDGVCVKCKCNPIVNKKQGTEPLRAIAPMFPFFFFLWLLLKIIFTAQEHCACVRLTSTLTHTTSLQHLSQFGSVYDGSLTHNFLCARSDLIVSKNNNLVKPFLDTD